MNYTTNIRGFLSFSVFCRCSRRRERQSFACAGMADDGGEGGGDSEGKELGEQQLVAVTAAVVVPIVVSQKKLLVLDVNGLLVATYYKQETLPPEPYHVKLGNFYGDTSMLHVFFSFFLSLFFFFAGEFFFHVVIVGFDDAFVKKKKRFSILRSFLVILGSLLHPPAEDYQGFASDVMFLEGVLLRTRICLIVCFLLPQCTRGHFVKSSFAFAWKTLPLESGLRHKREFRPAFLHA
jgi:hypothetical protein